MCVDLHLTATLQSYIKFHMVEVSRRRPNGVRFCLLPTGLYVDPQNSIYTNIRSGRIAGVDLLLYMTVAGF